MRLTVRHYFDFGVDRETAGNKLDPQRWDALRVETEGAFALPETRAEWDRRLPPELGGRADAIAGVVGRLGARRLASYGVGDAGLEFLLKERLPGVSIVCGDATPRAVARVAGLVPELEFVVHNLLYDPPLEADAHLVYRIDTEFNDRQWRSILCRFHQPLIIVPAEDAMITTGEALHRAWFNVRHRPWKWLTHAGYCRTRPALEALWARSHTHERFEVGDIAGYLLQPR